MAREHESIKLAVNKMRREVVEWEAFSQFKAQVEQALESLLEKQRDDRASQKALTDKLDKEWRLRFEQNENTFKKRVGLAVKD